MGKQVRAVIVTFLFVALMAITANAETEQTNHEYTAIFEAMTAEDYDALEQVVYWESAREGCPITTNVAVVRTVLNRVLSDEFPDTVSGVIYQKGQFWTKHFHEEAINEAVSDAIDYVYLHGAEDFPLDSLYFATKKQSLGKNHQWIGGRTANGKPRKGYGMWFCQGK